MRTVFIHGSGGMAESFYFQLREIPGSEAVDLPGHPEGRPCTSVDAYAEWVRGYLAGRGYRGNVVLGGHSLGGAIVQLYALKYPEELKGIILIGTGARLRVHPNILNDLERALRNPEAWAEQQRREFGFNSLPPAERERLLQKRLRIGPAVLLNDLLCCDRFDLLDRVHLIRLPALIIVGTEDTLTPVRYARYLADKIAGSRLVVVEGATHHVHQERPVAVNAAIREFLEGLAEPGG